jgi:hypothetical protein
VLAAALLSSILLIIPSTDPADGEALVRAMHQRYEGKWYHSLTFTQTTSWPKTGRQETWYESALIPGTLRIDIAPIDSGNAILFRRDSVYRYKAGAIVASRPLVHPLMVLGFDVYAEAPEITLGKLKDLGFDLSKIRQDNWQGRPVWVVGTTSASDTTTRQFWIDKERLYFVRMLEPSRDSTATLETQFNKYQPLGKGWVSIEVVFKHNGEVETTEQYADVKADTPLPEAMFDPAQYTRPSWVKP